MTFKKTENIKGPVFSTTFIEIVKGLIKNQNVIHHSPTYQVKLLVIPIVFVI